MVRNYKFYDKEAIDPIIISYEFDPPFCSQLDEELKSTYGDDLIYVKEINHRDRIIRLHTAYDSGKGTLYLKNERKEEQISEKESIRFWIKKILIS